MLSIGLVFLGGGLGAVLRHGVSLATARCLGAGFPYATLTVNILGCYAMGLLAGSFAFKGEVAQPWRLFFTTGVLGGFTTFSAFALEVVSFFERGQIRTALFYVLLSLLASTASLALGLLLMRPLS